jgi:hypothetical protein
MRYFFHVHDGTYLADLEGTELPDDGAARREAMAASVGLLRDLGERVWTGKVWQMKVEDENGREVFSLIFKGEMVEGAFH